MESAEEQFDKLYQEKNFLLSLVSDKDLVSNLKLFHSYGLDCIDFMKNKIRVCKDILKLNSKDCVVQEELKQYEMALFVLKFCDSLVFEQYQERFKKLNG